MKARLQPTEIRLSDLPPEGRDYVYTDQGGELSSALTDLIGARAYHVEFHLAPVGNVFHLKGKLKTSFRLLCSRCAGEFDFPVEQLLHEVLVVQPPLNKGEQLTKTNHAHEWEPNGPDYLTLDSENFAVGPYIHEVIALAEPMRPDCGAPSCEEVSGQIQRDWLSIGDSKSQKQINSSPFKALENFKLKS